MKIVGFAISKDELWYSVLEGDNKSNAHIIVCGKHNFQSESNIADLMITFKNLFDEIIVKYSPQKIACKLYIPTVLKQIPYMHYSIGVLALICGENGISFQQRSDSWITASNKKKELECLAHFKDENLKKEKLHATLVAWYELG